MREDPKVLEAKTALKKHFVNVKGEPVRTPYYHHQLQVLYEDDFFEWVLTHALQQLEKEGFLTSLNAEDIPEFKSLRNVSRIKFYANAEAMKNEEEEKRMKTHAINTAKLVEKYSDSKNSDALGKQLESLVKHELRASQFEVLGIHTNEYNRERWTRTNHNLDIIARKRDTDFVIGVEVKNTLDIIEPSEIDIKIDICAHLGIVPVFAVRWIKPYLDCIRRQHGFSWMFKTQIFPYGFEDFTQELYQKLSELNKVNSRDHKLEFPVTVRNDLPPNSVNKFNEWVRQVENDPPEVDTSFRCGQPEPEPEPEF